MIINTQPLSLSLSLYLSISLSLYIYIYTIRPAEERAQPHQEGPFGRDQAGEEGP